MTKIDMKIN